MPKAGYERPAMAERREEEEQPDSEAAQMESPESVDFVTSQEQTREEDPPRKRTGKKKTPNYSWTAEGSKKLAEFVMQHPQLYKRQRDWLNLPGKTRLWAAAGAEQDPPATGAQCKKHYESMRAKVGKIMKGEQKSDSGQTQKSVRDEDSMSTWMFLNQHIVRGNTYPSEEFASTNTAPTGDPEEEDNDDVSSNSSEVMPATRKSTSASTSQDSQDVAALITDPDLSETFVQMLKKAIGPTLTGHSRVVHDFASLLESLMQSIPLTSWHEFQIECLNVVHKFSQQPPQQQSWQPPQQVPWSAPHSSWQPPEPAAPHPSWLPPQTLPPSSWLPSHTTATQGGMTSAGDQRAPAPSGSVPANAGGQDPV
ncbi:uncharacterized protein LOC117513267 [Thalassophryne amazonica]|uniref:uncharacterized protein LOC117513267 n=1 Tax=Thalassophryne amazonica TaxID=390379 RepID=UPI00147213A0|nr:uncharacterized protein LOC117513267 [Thalassophryne amazonica]